jgi:hypothetical protein
MKKIITDEEIKKGLNKAYNIAGDNAYFGDGFKLGIEFAKNKLIGHAIDFVDWLNYEPQFTLFATNKKDAKELYEDFLSSNINQ